MSSNNGDELELSPPPPFDERAIRRAVRRGVIRTAFHAIGWFFLASIALQLATNGWLQAGGRRERMDNVILKGLQVAYPEYETGGWGCCNRSLTRLTGFLDVTLRSPNAAYVPALELRPTQDLLGRFDPFSVSIPSTRIGQTIQGPPISKDAATRTLQQLPLRTNVSAVVLFDHPLDQSGVNNVFRAAGEYSFLSAGVLFDVPRHSRWVGSPQGTKSRIGWPQASLSQFERWAESLSTSDDTTLHQLGLPRAEDITEIASGGSSGIVIGSMSRGAALRLLEHPLVGSVLATEVAFDLVER
jgi:hypothetical protein